MKTIRQTASFDAPHDEVYATYTDGRRHARAIGADAKVTAKVGGTMSAWGGYCTGTFLALVPGRLVVQTWREDSWAKNDPDSILVLAFEPAAKGTKLTMVHAHVPDGRASQLDQGWKAQYWEPWKAYFARRRHAARRTV